MTRLGSYIRIAAGICLLTVCMLALSNPTDLRSVYYRIFHPSMFENVLVGAMNTLVAVTEVLAWSLFCAGGIGLIFNKRWAFWLVYAASILNLSAGYTLVPFARMIINRWFDPMLAMIVSLYGINALFIALLVFAHLATRQRLSKAKSNESA